MRLDIAICSLHECAGCHEAVISRKAATELVPPDGPYAVGSSKPARSLRSPPQIVGKVRAHAGPREVRPFRRLAHAGDILEPCCRGDVPECLQRAPVSGTDELLSDRHDRAPLPMVEPASGDGLEPGPARDITTAATESRRGARERGTDAEPAMDALLFELICH